MSLIELWKTSREQLERKTVSQLIAISGEGRLRDGNATSSEFRDFLANVSSEHLRRFAGECLELKFEDPGLALQDVVNQIGRRLGFSVQDGRYRGIPTAVGFDGLWTGPEANTLVVEVKTTDAYRMDLDVIAGYRRELMKGKRFNEEDSSILIVVGRQDTGDLEAQIRGSRHAWDIRLISVEYLLKLLQVKEGIEDPETARRIRAILVPQEYTRVDGIIDLLFSTTEDIQQEAVHDTDSDDEKETAKAREPKFTPVAFHDACVRRIQIALKIDLLKRSRATYSTADEKTVLICSVSREYERKGGHGYWYAFHPHQKETLDRASQSFVAFGCGSPNTTLLIPFRDFEQWLDGMHQTTLDNGKFYWHVHIHRENQDFYLVRRKGKERVALASHLLR